MKKQRRDEAYVILDSLEECVAWPEILPYLVRLIDIVHHLRKEGRFTYIDDLLSETCERNLPPEAHLSLLRFTSRQRSRLKSWTKSRDCMAKKLPEDKVSTVMKGLLD